MPKRETYAACKDLEDRLEKSKDEGLYEIQHVEGPIELRFDYRLLQEVCYQQSQVAKKVENYHELKEDEEIDLIKGRSQLGEIEEQLNKLLN